MSDPLVEAKARWAGSFLAFQKEMPSITKDQKATIPTKAGGSYSYTYADLADICAQAMPVLNKYGLSVAQNAITDAGQIGVMTRIYHEEGHVEIFGPLLLPGGQDARSAGSAVTYARRYALTAALGIAVEDDDDGNRANQAAHKEPELDSTPDPVDPLIEAKMMAVDILGDKDEAAKAWTEALNVLGIKDETRLGQKRLKSIVDLIQEAKDAADATT